MKIKDRILGSMLAGAAGDALGYEVEFSRLNEIKRKYGAAGIRDFTERPAKISDDTQMTLFTANGLIYGYTMAINRGVAGEYKDYIWLAYRDWYEVQHGRQPEKRHCWIADVPAMAAGRAPGATCFEAIANSEKGGTIEKHINSSKGCGGVMRVAPVGLFLDPMNIYDEDTGGYVCRVGAECAALTHGHPLGYIASGCMALIVNMLAYREHYGVFSVKEAVTRSLKKTCEVFSDDTHCAELQALIDKAIELSEGELNDEDAVFVLGEGWTAEEALAIAVFCALRHEDDICAAIRAAVNHDGDSDSTGAIAGNILGAWLGIDAVRAAFDISAIEAVDVITEISEDLAYAAEQSDYDADFESDAWADKYIFVKKRNGGKE